MICVRDPVRRSDRTAAQGRRRDRGRAGGGDAAGPRSAPGGAGHARRPGAVAGAPAERYLELTAAAARAPAPVAGTGRRGGGAGGTWGGGGCDSAGGTGCGGGVDRAATAAAGAAGGGGAPLPGPDPGRRDDLEPAGAA